MKWLHALAHRLGLNVGYVVSVTDRHHLTWMGFRCARCGRVSNKDLASWHRVPKDEEFT